LPDVSSSPNPPTPTGPVATRSVPKLDLDSRFLIHDNDAIFSDRFSGAIDRLGIA
jgi:hypothetical protein